MPPAVAERAFLRLMYGDVLSSNHRMLQLTARLGFTARFGDDDPRVTRVEANL
ncbi:hypothetical protein D3C83_188570 [compost metagenome]